MGSISRRETGDTPPVEEATVVELLKEGLYPDVIARVKSVSKDGQDTSSWHDFASVVELCDRLNCGSGFMFNGDGIAGVVLDDCRNPETEEIRRGN